MDIFDLLRNIALYIVYPICIVLIGQEIYRYIYMRYVLIDEDDEDDDNNDYREFHEPSIKMCSRCKNPSCSHRIADYVEEE